MVSDSLGHLSREEMLDTAARLSIRGLSSMFKLDFSATSESGALVSYPKYSKAV